MGRKKVICNTCNRPEKYFEGCSHPDCSKRKHVTARLDLDKCAHGDFTQPYISSGIFKVPSNKE